MATFPPNELTGELIKAARALLRLRIEDLAAETMLGLATLKRAEASAGGVRLTAANAARIIQVLEARGLTLIPADGRGGAGLRLMHREPNTAGGGVRHQT